MKPMKSRMLTTTVIPIALAAGFTLVTVSEVPSAQAAQSIAQNRCNPCAAKKRCNPCAAKKGCNPCAAKRGCNPCAAKKGCNPCAAKKGCNPCGAKNACNPCNPCAGGAASYSSKCVVPRLASANPCAAKRGCNPCGAKKGCNPCGAKRGCNPCAAKKGCNPCAAKKGCNPCAAKKGCNPCAAKKGCNPCAAKKGCNPCAAKKGCNPCAAKNPCNPCAAKNPCNPCAAKNPCNPCSAAAEVKLSKAEANALYNCLKGEMKTAYAKSGNLWAKWYSQWAKFSNQPYVSATHGNRFVHNYASKKAAGPYGKFEKVGKMTRGGILAKDSFTVTPQGRVSVGPLFLMEKMSGGFLKASNDWRYTLIMPNGQTVGTTEGKGSKNVKFCITCHQAVADGQDAMFFLPEEYRAK